MTKGSSGVFAGNLLTGLEASLALIKVGALSLRSAPPESPAIQVGDYGGASLDLASVYEAHFDFVWRSLRRLGVPWSVLDDAAQEVFLVARRRLPEFEGRSSVKTWLFSIAWRVSKRARRTAEHFRSEEIAEAMPDVLGVAPDEAVNRGEELRLVYRALATLDENHRAVFVLSELEQMPAREIAEALYVPMNTVYSRLRVARQRFETALRRETDLKRRRDP